MLLRFAKSLLILLAIVSYSTVMAQDIAEKNAGTSEVDGVTERELLLGTHQPLTGPASKFSSVLHGADAWFQYLNDQGGVNGRKVRLLARDDGFQPERSKVAVKQLVLDDGVFAIFAGLGSKTHGAVGGWLARMGIPDFMIASPPLKNTPTLRTAPNRFGFWPTAELEGEVLAQWIAREHAGEKVAIWHLNQSPYQEAAQALSRALQSAGIAGTSIAHPEFGVDFATESQRIAALEPANIVLLTTSYMGSQILRQAKRDGLKARMFLGHDMADDSLIESAGADVMKGAWVVASLPFAAMKDHPGIRLHRKLMEVYQPDVSVDRWTVYGQAAAEAMTAVLHKAGRGLTRDGALTAAESLQGWSGPLTPPVTLSATNHSVLGSLRIARVVGRRFVFVSGHMNGKNDTDDTQSMNRSTGSDISDSSNEQVGNTEYTEQ